MIDTVPEKDDVIRARQQATYAVSNLGTGIFEEYIGNLKLILDRNRNDGVLDEESWYALRDLIEQLKNAQAALLKFRRQSAGAAVAAAGGVQ